ncbi:sugar ABC transporter substrate-binding protein [Angustibacter luteus]|uniref:Sugar ABC transporter substrate-binding protein n=1 Tax=Angustibacter luteus TaxID=658456 RepID=A0ABW1J9V1_9ACTN
MAAIGALGVALALTACGSSDDNASGGSSTAASKGKIGVILPDTKSSARWESSDRPALEKAFKDAGIPAVIDNAQGDATKMQTIADQMLTQGVTVLAIVNLDSDSGAAIEAKAKKQGVATIDYDRLTLGGSADYYVSFDNSKVGTLQGEALAKCLGDKPANIVYLNGSPTDNNATLFAAGAHKVLDAKTEYKQVAEQAVPKWDNLQAGTIFEQMFTQQKGKIDGVLAANDGLGNAAIAILKKNHLEGKVPVTGQDATVQGLQNVLDGSQCMTVYKSAKEEVGALADLAIAITKGQKGTTTGTVHDDTGNRDVPSVLLDPKSITADSVKDVVSDGGASAAEVCTGAYAELCTKYGVS